MSLLTANSLAQTFAFVDVFAGISVNVADDAKIGLIGPNGIGKTTLLRILAGQETPTRGEMHIARGRTVGYLPQEAVDAFGRGERPVLAEMLYVFESLHAIEARMRELEELMLTDFSVMDEYGEMQHRFEHAGGYDYEVRIRQTLDGLGFAEHESDRRRSWHAPVAQLSGGQKTRALLAKLLLLHPDLLILDEPTNHLDVDAIEWLEETLDEWKGALIVCSHDRLFLDRVINRIWEMSRTDVDVYRGNYSAYLTQREERFERRLALFNAEKARLENDARLIKRDYDRIKAGWTDEEPTWAKGKLRRLSTDVVVIEKFGVEVLLNEPWAEIAVRLNADGGVPSMFSVEDAIKRTARLRPPQRAPRLNLNLEPAKRSGEIVLRTKDLQVGYPGGRPLFTCEDLELRWRERAALIGPNGCGKTTFLKTALAGRTLHDERIEIGLHPEMQLPPLAGMVEAGASLRIGYFAQAHDELDPTLTIQDELMRHAEQLGKRMNEGELRFYMAQFLYTDDDLFKPVGGLSGGERARLALAVLQLQGANFLVLDEPTNHLDLATQEVLENVLSNFEGTVLLVSHDRYLIRKLAQQIWYIEDGKLRVYRGTYDEFAVRKRRVGATSAVPAPAAAPTPKVEKPTEKSDATSTSMSMSTSMSKNAQQKKQQRVAEVEARIVQIEAEIKALGAQMQTPDKVREFGEKFKQMERELAQRMAEWEELAA
ncbi:MAG: ABC-F family ATP-binding cassette domain-containing protein [Chloroflexi bacterium]|nr:ABC-F family ATP-binding cassette domain-containing protein [Chloroflexota bacterium]